MMHELQRRVALFHQIRGAGGAPTLSTSEHSPDNILVLNHPPCGISPDTAAVTATVLECILCGEHCDSSSVIHHMPTKLGFSRHFKYHLVGDL
jgi:hypothetical protein